MDFLFTEEQTMLRDSVARYLDKTYDFDARQALLRSEAPYSKAAWSQFAELGVLALPFPEDVGGLGDSVTDLVPVAEVFGEHLTVEPWAFALTLAGGALAAAGNHAAARKHLADLVSGASIGAFAYDEHRGIAVPAQIAMTATPSGDGFVLNGENGWCSAQRRQASWWLPRVPPVTRAIRRVLSCCWSIRAHQASP